jgi:3-oxoacyl-[acyl-carrier-protein] synthase-3
MLLGKPFAWEAYPNKELKMRKMEQHRFFRTRLEGVGKCLPKRVITNGDLAKILDTSDDWISSRTGIRERRVVSGDETSVDLAVGAARDALGFAGVSADDIDLIITATSMPDNLYPSTSCEVQGVLKASNAAAFDIVAACSGFIYGLSIAHSYITNGTYKKILLIGVDIHSRFVNWADRSTCILFGDGAGAVVLSRSEDERSDILSIDLRSDGIKAGSLKIPLYGKNCPLVEPNSPKEQHVIMDGSEIMRFALTKVPESITHAVGQAGFSLDEIDYFLLHQANSRIISAIGSKLNIPAQKLVMTLDKYGNTSTASIPLTIVDMLEQNCLLDGSTLALCGFGAGLTWGTAIVKWHAKDSRKTSV